MTCIFNKAMLHGAKQSYAKADAAAQAGNFKKTLGCATTAKGWMSISAKGDRSIEGKLGNATSNSGLNKLATIIDQATGGRIKLVEVGAADTREGGSRIYVQDGKIQSVQIWGNQKLSQKLTQKLQGTTVYSAENVPADDTPLGLIHSAGYGNYGSLGAVGNTSNSVHQKPTLAICQNTAGANLQVGGQVQAEAATTTTATTQTQPFGGLLGIKSALFGAIGQATSIGSAEKGSGSGLFGLGKILGPVLQGVHGIAETAISMTGLGKFFEPIDKAIVHPILWDPLSSVTNYDVSDHPDGIKDATNPLGVDRK